MTDEGATMGTTGTPDISGADAAEDPDRANGSARGVDSPMGDGGELDRPGLPYDRPPAPDDPVHRAPGYST